VTYPARDIVHYQCVYGAAASKAPGTVEDSHRAGIAAVLAETEYSPELIAGLREFFPEGITV
jgi:hypothetical protein